MKSTPGGVGSQPSKLSFTNILARLDGVRGSVGGKAEARCPAHEDGRQSLSISRGEDGRVLLHCHAGCTVESIVAALGVDLKDLFPESGTTSKRRRIVATYSYGDESGVEIFQVVRFEPKDFRQRHRAKPGEKADAEGWCWDMTGVRRVLYRLPEVCAAAKAGGSVFVVEGEKDVDALIRLGLCATCNPGGAGKWKAEYTASLQGATHVYVIPDRDEPGRKHAATVVEALAATGIDGRIVELPGTGKDVSDWIAAGGTREGLEKIAEEAPSPSPSMPSTLQTQNRLTGAEPPVLPPFPEDAWRGLFAGYRELISGTTEYPLSAGWAACASGLSVLIGRDATLPWGPSILSPIIYTCSVGETGKGRKSTALDDVADMMVEPLKAVISPPGEPPILTVVNGTGSGEGFMAAVADLEWRPNGVQKEDPPSVQTGRRAIITIHEFGALLEKIRRDQAGNMLEFLLRGFDAPRVIERRTATNGVVAATNATVVVAAATTIDYLVDNLTPGQVYAGLANRFLWFTGKRGAPISCRPTIDPEKIRKFQDRLRDCLASVRGRSFGFDANGRALHDALYAEEYRREEGDGLTDAGTARTDQLALRLAMLFAAADASVTITNSHVDAAWKVAHYSRPVAAMVVGKLAAQNMRDAEARVRRAMGRVAKQGEPFRRRDVWQRIKGRHGLDAEMFNRVWESLVRASDISEQKEDSGTFTYSGGES